MRTLMLSLISLLAFSSSSFAQTKTPAQQGESQVQLTCVANIMKIAGSKVSYDQIQLKKIVDGRVAGPVDDSTLTIDVTNAPIVVLSLQFTPTKALDVQGVIETQSGIGPELTYTLDPIPGKQGQVEVERYLQVGCGLAGRTISFKKR